jgi:TRAP transporter TAXI family solute receptor
MLGFNRWHLLTVLAAGFCIAGLSWFALDYFVPAPPSKITIATSFTGGHYQDLGRRYKEILERSRVRVETLATEGAVENLKLLNDPTSKVQIGFMQGGVSKSSLAPDLLSLGRIDYQIFWLFYRAADTYSDLTQLKGKRIALGPAGSGTRAVSEKILGLGGINYDNTTLLTIAARGAVTALSEGKIDALFLVFAPDSPILNSLLMDPQYKPMSFADAEALTRIFPYLVRLVLPRSVIDFEKKIPATDVTIIATTNVVLVRKELHPAIIDLLAKTILEAHNEAGLFQRVGDFPTQVDPEFPMSESARDFYKNGPSFLNRYLPFWMTNYVQRIIAVLAAVVAIVLPVFSYAPRFYRGLVEHRLRSLYRRLRAIEQNLHKDVTATEVSALEFDVESVDRATNILGVPMRHSELFFSLKVHIDLVRDRLATRRRELLKQASKAA